MKTLVYNNSFSYDGQVPAALIGVTDIAQMLSVTQQRATQIIESYGDFPEAAAIVGNRRAWHRHEVERWMERHPKRRPGRPRKEEG